MYAPSKLGEQPSIEVSKEFMLKPNKIHLEASLDKEVSRLIIEGFYAIKTQTFPKISFITMERA